MLSLKIKRDYICIRIQYKMYLKLHRKKYDAKILGKIMNPLNVLIWLPYLLWLAWSAYISVEVYIYGLAIIIINYWICDGYISRTTLYLLNHFTESIMWNAHVVGTLCIFIDCQDLNHFLSYFGLQTKIAYTFENAILKCTFS